MIRNDNISFKANMVAQCGQLKLYKLTDSADIRALKDFCKKTDFQKLMPGLKKNKTDRWHEMLEYAIENTENPGNVSYVESINNKICGIITYFPNPTTIIDCICTIPVKTGEKVKLAGKTLFYQVFKDFLEYKGSRIKLAAITNGPYNTIKKYKELGFKETMESTYTTTEMEVNKFKVKEAANQLKSIIPYKQTKTERVDLRTLLN